MHLLKQVLSWLTAASLLAPSVAFAAGPSAESCISANEDGAVLRKRGKLLASKTSLAACSNEACPKVVRDDCAKNLQELEAAIPTIRFQAMEGATELDDVRVLMDGAPLFEKLGGEAVAVDPGEHVFTVLAKDRPAQTRKIVLEEGGKDRVEVIRFGAAPVSPTAVARLVVMTEPGAGIVVDGKGPTLGRFDGVLAPGGHEVRVTKAGKIPVFYDVDLRGPGETQMNVTLQNDKPDYFPWIVGGAIVVAGLLIGGGIAIAAGK